MRQSEGEDEEEDQTNTNQKNKWMKRRRENEEKVSWSQKQRCDSVSWRHRCVSTAGGKRRRKHDYYLPDKNFKAFIAAAGGALNIPVLCCETSAGTLVFVLGSSLLLLKRPHKRLNNVWLSEKYEGWSHVVTKLFIRPLTLESVKETFARPKTSSGAGCKCQEDDDGRSGFENGLYLVPFQANSVFRVEVSTL